MAFKSKIIIIAEAGLNHNGKYSLARKLVKAAAASGCDFIKFQTFKTEALLAPKTPLAPYQKKMHSSTACQNSMLKRLALNYVDFKKIKTLCFQERIGFLSTAFDSESLSFIETLQPAFHKISSGDINNYPFLRQVAKYQRPVILSTGMATIQEVRLAVQTLREAGLALKKIVILQCHSDYPTQPKDVNLNVLKTYQTIFKTKVGLSDHSFGIYAPLAAVALGAVVIEKHITLSRKMKGPDHAASLEPEELKNMVTGVRMVEESMGSGVKKPSPREKGVRVVARKSIFAKTSITAGEILSGKNMIIQRPATGLSPAHWHRCLGKKARKNFIAGEPIRT